MVKIKIIRAGWPEERPYLHGVYEAFKLEYPDYPTEYAAQVSKDKIIIVKQENCIEVTDVAEVIVKQVIGGDYANATTPRQFTKDVMELHRLGFKQSDIVNHLFRKYNRDQVMYGRVLYNFRTRVRMCITRNKDKDVKI